MKGSPKLHTKTNVVLITAQSASERQGVAASGGSGRLRSLPQTLQAIAGEGVSANGALHRSEASRQMVVFSRPDGVAAIVVALRKKIRIPGFVFCLGSVKKQRTDETDTGIS
jgi:hypothetical protein